MLAPIAAMREQAAVSGCTTPTVSASDTGIGPSAAPPAQMGAMGDDDAMGAV